jgi:hypothetical protein
MLKTVLSVFLCTLTIACGKNKPSKPHPIEPTLLEQFEDKYYDYLLWSRAKQDQYGFIHTDECDALLYTGLYSITGEPVEIEAARDELGRWHRRPIENPCYVDGQDLGSKSTISRDMFTGLFWHIVWYKRLDLAEQIWRYGRDNGWKMGSGDITRIYLTPGRITQLANIIRHLGGPERWITYLPHVMFDEVDGFRAHLNVLNVLLSGVMDGHITDKEQELITSHHFDWDNGNNALFNYAFQKWVGNGDYTHSIQLLMNETWFPRGHLPTGCQRYGANVWSERPGDHGLRGFSDQCKRVHAGLDLLFTGTLILKDLGRL